MPQPSDRRNLLVPFLAILAIVAAVAFATQRAAHVWDQATPALSIP